MNILDLLDRPIAYHRIFARLTGSVHAALMLSQAVYWQNRATSEDGWWWKTTEEWIEETGLTRFEQETARRNLRKAAFWHEKRRGMPAKIYYHIDSDELRNSLENVSLLESSNQVCGKAANKNAEIPQTCSLKSSNHLKEHRLHTEITTEITTETTTPPDGDGSSDFENLKDLILPPCLKSPEKASSTIKKLNGLDTLTAQKLLDATAWQAQNGGFKTRDGRKSTPLRFLDYLCRELKNGTFDDSGALEIQEKRQPLPVKQTKPRSGQVPDDFRKLGNKAKKEVNH